MATTEALLLPQVKAILNIGNGQGGSVNLTTFDSQLTDHMRLAVSNLYPQAQAELTPDTSLVWPSSDNVLTLPTGVRGIRMLEIKSDATYYRRIDSSHYMVHGSQVILGTLEWASYPMRVWGLGNYVLHASSAASTTLPSELEVVVVYWTVALFYESLAGNRRRYNVYVGAAGAAADQDIKDSAEYFTERGQEILLQRSANRSS